jgi:hypothetical protein
LQRIEEFKLHLDMTEDDKAKKNLQDEHRAYLTATLPAIEEYFSSSDEEEACPMSSVSSSVKESPGNRVRKRLHGIIEKWNSDVDSVNEEEEYQGKAKAGNDPNAENNCNDGRIDEEETNYSSDSGSEALRGDGPFTVDRNETLEEDVSERFFGTATDMAPILKRGGVSRRNNQKVKVSSFVSVNALTGQQIDEDEEVFTASDDPEISGMLSQESYSTSSQFSAGEPSTMGTASTIKVSQPTKISSSKTSSSSTSTSRSATASSSKSSYFTNPPPSTSKIITRARKAFPHEEDIGNNLDIYSIPTNKKRKK